MNTITAYANEIRTQRVAGQVHVYDDMFAKDVKVGVVDMIHGFIHYTGAAYSAHEGVYAVIRTENGDPIGTLAQALKSGVQNGRDDRR